MSSKKTASCQNACCSECCNQLTRSGNDNPIITCRAYPKLMIEENDIKEDGCKHFNKDLRGQKTCLNCTHFLEGKEPALSCSQDPYKIVSSFSQACECFENKWTVNKKEE